MSTKHVIFIDSRVVSDQCLTADLDADTRRIIIDADQDGIAQMASALSGCHDLESIQIISHGSAGTIQIGSTSLDASQLDRHARPLAAIGSHLTMDADLLLYGCNVGQGKAGSDFIKALAHITGADVAASDDVTGRADDWDLECVTGEIATTGRFAAHTAISSLSLNPSSPAATPDLMNQAQSLEAAYRLSAINIGTRFATLVYGDINLSANTDDYRSITSETLAATYWGNNPADAGFDDNYTGFFSGNPVLGSHWTVLDDELPGVIKGNAYSASHFPASTTDGMTTHAQFTAGGLYHSYVSSFWHVDQVTNGYGDANALVVANDDTLVLAFRGTDQYDHSILGGQTWTGDGQYLHYEAFRPLLNSIQQYIQTHDEIRHIIVAGHSLGGALADIFTAIDARHFAADAGTDLLVVSLASSGIDPDLMTDTFDSQSYYGRFDSSVARVTKHWFSADELALSTPDSYYTGFANSLDRVYFDNISPSGSIPSSLAGYWPTSSLNANINFSARVNQLPNINNSAADYGTSIASHGFGAQHNSLIYSRNMDALCQSPLLAFYNTQTPIFGVGYYGFDHQWLKNPAPSVNDSGRASLNGTSGDDFIFGLEGNDSLMGNSGNDLLDGGSGSDTLDGGIGNDCYAVDSNGDVIIETSTLTSEVDSVQSSISFALNAAGRDQIENLTVLGRSNLDATGNARANVLTGNAGNNHLTGLGGDDSLNGAAGNDTLDGSTGNDTLTGGSGNDIYLIDSVRDVIRETSAGAGEIDTVQSSISFALNAIGRENLENLLLLATGNLNATGNAKANVLTGNAGNNLLSGLDGNDSLRGAAGNDTLSGGSGNDLLSGGAGRDSMNGGPGADRFDFDALSETPTGSSHDLISDFSHAQGDRIDLGTLDANTRLSGDQGFTFIGTAAFSGLAGQAHYLYNATAGSGVLSGDVNGDRVADFEIQLTGVPTLVAGDLLA